MNKITAAAAIAAALMIAPASAATFGIYDGEEGYQGCDLNLESPDGAMTITAIKGAGVGSQIRIMFAVKCLKPAELQPDETCTTDGSDLKTTYPDDLELRLEVMIYDADYGETFRSVLIGEMMTDYVVPSFIAPLSLVSDMGNANQFTYILQNRPAVQIDSITKAQVEQFVACMSGY